MIAFITVSKLSALHTGWRLPISRDLCLTHNSQKFARAAVLVAPVGPFRVCLLSPIKTRNCCGVISDLGFPRLWRQTCGVTRQGTRVPRWVVLCND